MSTDNLNYVSFKKMNLVSWVVVEESLVQHCNTFLETLSDKNQ